MVKVADGRSCGMGLSPAEMKELAEIKRKRKEEEGEEKVKPWWKGKIEELEPQFERLFECSIKPLRDAELDELEEKFKLLSSSFSYFRGLIHAQLFEGKEPEEIMEAEKEMVSSLKSEEYEIPEESKPLLQSFLLGLSKLNEVDQSLMSTQLDPEIAISVFPFASLLNFAAVAGIALINDEEATIDTISWLSRRCKDYTEVVDMYLDTLCAEEIKG